MPLRLWKPRSTIVVAARRESLAVDPGHAEAQLRGPQRHAAVEAGLLGVVGAVAGFGRPPVARLATRDDVDHATDRVRAPEGRSRALHHLDALDRRRVDALKCGQPDRPGIDAHAVHHHQRLVAVGATDEDRGGLSRAAVAPEVQAGVKPQDVAGVARAAQFDRVAADQHHGREHFALRQRHPRGGDDEFFVGQLFSGGPGFSCMRRRRGCRGAGQQRRKAEETEDSTATGKPTVTEKSTHHPNPHARPQGQLLASGGG